MKTKSGILTFTGRIEQITVVRAVRNGLTNIIPVLLIGAFALILKTFPVDGYQTAIKTFANGFFLQLFEIVYSATFGVLSVYMTFSISYAYMRIKADPDIVSAGAIVASLISFFILIGTYLTEFGTESTGPKSMFLAIITGLGASWLYYMICKALKNRRRTLFSAGADKHFNRMLTTLLPISVVAVTFALLNAVVIRIFNVESFRELLANAFNALFSHGETGFLKGFFMVLLSSVLWFFGIHGSDTLEGVMQTYFAPGLAANQAAIAAGEAPTTILTKEFFDCFVLMGGCGATICLLLAILIFSRNRARRGLGIAAAFPMIFNINEMMVFGLPIILNPIMLIPFLAVPLVSYTTTYIAMATGIVPMITSEVAWTTPILLGGLHATGSVAGLLLQLVNVIIGVLIYLPFVRILDRQTVENAKRDYEDFVEFFKQNESEFRTMKLLERKDIYGEFAKNLCAELRHNFTKHIRLAYQPQYHYDGRCVGVEALLRFEHPIHGYLYPPAVIKLAEEGGFLPELEKEVLARALAERPAVQKRYGKDVKISVNVTGITVMTQDYLQFVKQLDAKDPFAGKNICIEVTEQAALAFNEETISILKCFNDMGIVLAIDDFSMGQTSLHYLKDSLFSIIKLDGSLTSELFSHQNSKEIVASVVNLANTIGLTVFAEYVETAELRDALHEIGCDIYQGYLYSPAVFLEDK